MTVSEQIIEVLDALCEKFGIAIDWTADTVLPYVKSLCTKLITWEISTSVYWICIFVTLTSVGVFITKKIYTKYNNVIKDKNSSISKKNDWETVNMITWICFIVLSVVSVGIIGFEIHDIITCVTFPEMVVIETIQSLMSQT